MNIYISFEKMTNCMILKIIIKISENTKLIFISIYTFTLCIKWIKVILKYKINSLKIFSAAVFTANEE